MTQCHGCDEDIGLLTLARVAIRYSDVYFCSDCCMDEWMDRIQDGGPADAPVTVSFPKEVAVVLVASPSQTLLPRSVGPWDRWSVALSRLHKLLARRHNATAVTKTSAS